MTIVETYVARHAGSAALYQQALQQLPSGVSHDARYLKPFSLYVHRSAGAYKWDVDGNTLIDYWMGHGALLLGHSHPPTVAAVQAQMARGTHFGAEHPAALRWAALVQQLVPGIERLRFTASGTEATMLAVRLARAFSGRPLIARFAGHYHGWHDTLAAGMELSGEPPGLPPALLGLTLTLQPEIAAVEQALYGRDDIAAVILEPTGASYGAVPLPAGFLQQLRALTTRLGVLLICDEVVTGFRVAPGGEQARAGIVADLTTFAKILAGGLPGGAVGGRADILARLAFGTAAAGRKVLHNGTFNANPLAAAAGVIMLETLANGVPGERAAILGRRLVQGINTVLRDHRAAGWAAYGDGSLVHLIAASRLKFAPGELAANTPPEELKRGGDPQAVALLRMALINHGVDLMRGRSAFISAAHSEDDIDQTVVAFAAALGDVLAELS